MVKYLMQKKLLDCFYSISKFSEHEQIRNSLLDLISKSEYTSPNHPISEVNISRCDWNNAQDFNRPWVAHIKDALLQHMLEVYKELGYDGFTLHEIWYQQYLKGSGHGWHTHSGNFTQVYYLEMSDDAPKTQLVSPYDQKTVIEVDVKEGDVISFPSFVIHKGPHNQSSKQKTIISFNTSVTYSDDIYGQHLGEKQNAIF